MEQESWRELAETLGIQVIAPCTLVIGGTHATFTALLPQFGGQAGMIADPDWCVIEPHADELTRAGFGYSCINVQSSNARGMQDVLADWGWNESGQQKPDWLD